MKQLEAVVVASSIQGRWRSTEKTLDLLCLKALKLEEMESKDDVAALNGGL